MRWQDLLQKEETVVLPYLGGNEIYINTHRTWTFSGNRRPVEHGWYEFVVEGRKIVTWQVSSTRDIFPTIVKGYLVGDRIVPDQIKIPPGLAALEINKYSFPVRLIESGVDKFSRAVVGRLTYDSPYVFIRQDFPLGPEDVVLEAFLDKASSVDHIPNVHPALELSFRLETFQRSETERIRRDAAAAEAARIAELEKQLRRQELLAAVGDASKRRELAVTDFGEAAKAALAVSNAVYLDHRKGHHRDEVIVRFRLNGRRFECVCHSRTLQILDSGICLTSHNGIKGDTWLSLESLPSVIQEAIDDDKLVIFRHA